MSVVASPGSSADVDNREVGVDLDADVEVARLRHPSAGSWQPDHVRLARRFAEALAASGAPCPDVAAAAVALRSRSGLDRTDFAQALGVTHRDLLTVEAGACPADRLPPPLADATFLLQVLSTLRSLRLAGCDGSKPGQSEPAATATGRPPVSFNRSP
jgi:hypothetical protein